MGSRGENRVVASFKGNRVGGEGRKRGWVQIRRVFRPRVVNKKRTNE